MTMPARARVLIVDDTPENIRLLMSFLRNLCDVVAATNGTKALEVARSHPRPDLILLDVIMPGLSGYEVCSELKRDSKTNSIPIIFVTSLTDAGDEEKGLRLGAVDYITKPFHPELVRARVHNHLELKRHRDFLESEVERRTQALLEAQTIRQRMDSELMVASRLQMSMLPPPTFSDARLLGCQLATALQAARTVGGDLYDYFFLDELNFLFVLGDVSDKGVPAALFMVRVRTLIRTLGPTARCPASLLLAINQSLCADNPACMFVTLVCGILRMDTGEVRLARGGHEHPILVGPENQVRAVEFEGGPALGLCADGEFENHRLVLAPGQALVLYTDGIPEACNRQGQCFGEERLTDCLGEMWAMPPLAIVNKVLEVLGNFVIECEPFDDITILVIKTHQQRSPAAETEFTPQ